MQNDVIKQIYLENKFIQKYFFSTNIDYLIKNDAGIFALEIKYRYPAKNNTFGINYMQYEVYSLFIKSGISCYSIKLLNKEKIDILQRRNREKQKWIYASISNINNHVKYAPKKTSYKLNQAQGYYELDMKSYKELIPESNFINLICPLCEGKLIIRKGKYGKFLGCENFPSENCRGKINL